MCHAADSNESALDLSQIILNVTLPINIVQISSPAYTKLHENVQLYCVVKGYPVDGIQWLKNDNEILNTTVEHLNTTHKNATIFVKTVTKKDNGTYICQVYGIGNYINKTSAILVKDKPQISIDFIKSIATDKIYFNWTLNDGNCPEKLQYKVQYKSLNDSNYIYYPKEIDGKNRSYVLKEVFKKNGEYTIRIMASNSEGSSQYSVSNIIKMLEEDPIFIPNVTVTGVTTSSITIKWTQPPDKIKDHIHYYNLISKAVKDSEKFEAIQSAMNDYIYLFSGLKSATTYNFQVAACSEYSHECGPWSKIVNGTTMDGISGPPVNATVECGFDNISQISYIYVAWQPPIQPHGIITSYNIHLEGSATFRNELGNLEHLTWGPKVTSISETNLNTKFYNVSANTNYTVKISAVTRLRKNGEFVTLQCKMPSTLPDKSKLSRFEWRKMEEEGKWMFKLSMPRVSERNGPICCYRVYLVRMEAEQKLAELPVPEDLTIVSYQEAHRTPKGGAYVAEMFTRYFLYNYQLKYL